MNRIVKILMERDNMTEEEAIEMVSDTRSEMEDMISCGDTEMAEEIFSSDLGLEPDYLIDIF